jgi:hypothetical protein
VEGGKPQGGWGPSVSGSQTEGIARGSALCLPWDSFRVSNDCVKIEQVFESRQAGLSKNPRLWRKILHARDVKSRAGAVRVCLCLCVSGAADRMFLPEGYAEITSELATHGGDFK